MLVLLRRTLMVVGLVALGYMLGTVHALSGNPLLAQGEEKPGGPAANQEMFSKDTADKIKAAREASEAAMAALQKEKGYVPAIEGLNSFAATVGGIDAIQDLKSGRGVDPETFAGLYAGLAIEEVAADLGRDDQDRLTYQDKVVRMYPISRIKQLFQSRAAVPEDHQPGAPAGQLKIEPEKGK